MAVKCPNCHTDNPEMSRFCGNCATQITELTKTLQSPINALAGGSLIGGKYRIVSEIGRGGMGVVYKAEDVTLNRPVALKFLPPLWTLDPEARERFITEARAASALDHSNICTIYETGESDDMRIFIAMAFYEGESLREKVRRGPMKTGEAISIAIQVAQGMAKAHEKGIIHRDIKPANIIITSDGIAKIIDFGLAKLAGQAKLTKEGSTVGTAAYMSPEQMKGELVDQRTDIWSLGIILYEMLSGRLPFKGDLEQNLIHSILTSEPELVSRVRKDLPKGLEQVISKTLMKNVSARYQNMVELLDDLKAIAEGLKPLGATLGLFQGRIFGIRKEYVYGGLACLITMIVIGSVLLHNSSGNIALAVLPFKDLSGEQNQGVFCEGISDDIRSRLSGIEKLNVISKFSSDQFEKTELGLKDIGKKLGVRKILSGTLQIEKDLIRITVDLSDANSEYTRWSRRYDKKLENYFLVEDSIAGAIAEELKVQLNLKDIRSEGGKEPVNWSAYSEYRWGKHYERIFRNLRKEEDFQEAVRRYKNAIEYDQGYCPAYWGLGDSYESHFVLSADPRDRALMEKYYTASYEINSNLAESSLRMGWIHFYREDLDKAFFFFKKARELDPNNQEVNFGVGSFLRSIGLYESAVNFYRRAVELDPLSYRTYLTYITSLSFIGNFKEALALAKRAVEIEPNIPLTHLYYARQLLLANQYDEAEQELLKAEKIQPDRPRILTYLKAWIAAARGQKDDALEIVQKSDRPWAYEITNTYCLLGMIDEAISGIQEGIENGFHTIWDYVYSYPYLETNPLLSRIKNDPRFQKILAEEKDKYEIKEQKYGAL